MRLIDTQTHLLLEPWKAAGKEYAILSHTWGDQEVIFQEWEQLFPSGAIKGQCPHVRHDGIDKKAGYHKVVQACEQARRDGIRYLWCDTMCINKESSAELSEAINSMLDAKICYVYLTDVIFPSKKTRHGLVPNRSSFPGWFPYALERKQDDDVSDMKARFMASRWWTRGWTLQELLAPKHVAFFTQDWVLLGHKSGIAHWISTVTRIHQQALEDCTTMNNFSIAQRMSWAADRTTTVVEDMAYCLLGIFDINMPMLYGQGEGAFQKLQHEIIKVSGDQSIFAWTMEYGEGHTLTGALANSPRYFKNCGSIVCDPLSAHEPYTLTNVGFIMRIPTIRMTFETQSFIGLGCFLELHSESQKSSVNTNRRWIQVWIPVTRRGLGESYERIHEPTSHIHLQSSYPAYNKIVSKPELFLVASSSHSTILGNKRRMDGSDGIHKTGMIIALGFGNMSMVSKAYTDIWYPQDLRIIHLGHREPHSVSHQVISSGHYCIILSVAWDDHSRPRMHKHTTLHADNTYNFSRLIEQLQQEQGSRQVSDRANGLHQTIRSQNHGAVVAGQSAEAPMIIVEEEPLYDMHQSAFVMVDIIFRERCKTDGDRK